MEKLILLILCFQNTQRKYHKSISSRGDLQVAQVPPTYHVPAPIKHPLVAPPVTAFRYPAPLKVPPVGAGPELVVVVGEVDPDFGRYLTPVAGQSDFDPSGPTFSKVPVWIEPLTL